MRAGRLPGGYASSSAVGSVARRPYGLGMPPERIDRLILDRMTAQARAQQPATLFDVGRPTVEEQASNKGAVRTFIERGSGNAEYDTARIARDRPDILDRMKAGEYQSARVIATACGIVTAPARNPSNASGASFFTRFAPDTYPWLTPTISATCSRDCPR